MHLLTRLRREHPPTDTQEEPMRARRTVALALTGLLAAAALVSVIVHGGFPFGFGGY